MSRPSGSVSKERSGNSHLGRDIPALLAAAGFDAALQSKYLHRPRFAGYHYWGEGVCRGESDSL